MTATYTTNLRITKQGDNDNPNTWGQVVNAQVIQLLEDAITRVKAIDCTGTTDINISTTTVSGGTDDARSAVLELTGTLGADINLILPSVEKIYLIRAAQTGGYTITVKPAGGSTTISFPTGKIGIIYTKGTNIYELGGTSLLVANNLSDVANAATAFTNIKQAATETATGVVELATTAEAAAGSDTTRAVTAAGLTAFATANSSIPVGTGMDYWGTTAPDGYLFPYGQAISRSTYSALFAVLSTTYGEGDGSTTFNLPDKRGRTSFGKDDMGGTSADRLTNLTGGIDGDTLGDVGGEEAHALTSAENGPHTHTIVTSPGVWNNGSNSLDSATGYSQGSRNTGSSGSGTAHNTLPPGIVCNYIIKY